MPLDTTRMVLNGHATSADMKQYADLLLGVMADQPVTVKNTVTVGASPLVLGSASTSPFIAPTLSGGITFGTNNAGRWNVAFGGDLVTQIDGAVNIGGPAAGRPQNIYATGALVIPTVTASVSVNSPLHTIGSTARTLQVLGGTSGYDLMYLQNATGTSSGIQGYLDLLATEAIELYFNYTRPANAFLDGTKPWGRLIISAAYGGGGLFYEVAPAGSASMGSRFYVTVGGNGSVSGAWTVGAGASIGTTLSVLGGTIYLGPGPTVNLVNQGGALLQIQNSLTVVSQISTPTYFVGFSNLLYVQDAGNGIIRYMANISTGRHNFENASAPGGYGTIYSGSINMSDGTNAVLNAMTGSLYLRSATQNVIMDGAGVVTISGSMSVTGVTFWAGGLVAGVSGYGWWGISGIPALRTNGNIVVEGTYVYLEAGRNVAVAWNGPYAGGQINMTYPLYVNGGITATSDIACAGALRFAGGPFLIGAGAGPTIAYRTTSPSAHSFEFITGGYAPIYASAFTPASARKFKADITPLADPLSIVLDDRVHGVTYTERASGTCKIGFIADDWAQVEPSVVGFKDGEIETLDYDRISAVTFEALKQHALTTNARLAALEKAA